MIYTKENKQKLMRLKRCKIYTVEVAVIYNHVLTTCDVYM